MRPDQFLTSHALAQKKLELLRMIARRGQLTTEIKLKILTETDILALEKVKTTYTCEHQSPASLARKKKLEPLANILWRQENVVPEDDALAFIGPGPIARVHEALAGAREIMAERIREDQRSLKALKELFASDGLLRLEAKNGAPLRNKTIEKYLNDGGILPVSGLTPVRDVLDAEAGGLLRLSLCDAQAKHLEILANIFIKKDNAAGKHMRMAMEDSYHQFLQPCLEVEIREQLQQQAYQEGLELLRLCGHQKKSPPQLKYLYLLLLLFIPLTLALSPGYHKDAAPKEFSRNNEERGEAGHLQEEPDGVMRQYFDDGRLKREETYKSAQREGIAKEYYPGGELRSIESYSDGKPHGSFREFLPDGRIISLTTYKNGVLHGESREYYANGQWKTIKNYREGQLEGFVREYDQTGRLRHKVYHHKDRPLREQIRE